MTSKPRPYRTITCEVCGRTARSNFKLRDVCRACYLSEPDSYCIGCKVVRPHVSPKSKKCARCIKSERLTGLCTRCGKVGILIKSLCKPCRRVKSEQTRNRKNLVKAICSVCSKLRRLATHSPQVCKSCNAIKLNGTGTCSGCGKKKAIEHRGKQLCKQCCQASSASQLLRKYTDEYTSPYPNNQFLFKLLIPSITWSTVKDHHYQTFRAIGQFLQSTQIPEPLKWGKIDELLPPLGNSSRRMRAKRIRQSLLDIGHALAKKGLLESREDYVRRRNALSPIAGAPEHLRPTLIKYADWLINTRKATLKNVREHMDAVAKFWSWSYTCRVYRLEEVYPELIDTYVKGLYKWWRCSACKKQNLVLTKPTGNQCAYCQASNSAPKVKNNSQNTVRNHRAKLKVFFTWARNNRMTVTMPVRIKTPAPARSITHYPIRMVESLHTYIWDPSSDPAGALILYLVLAHGFSAWELRHAQVPQVVPIHQPSRPIPLSESYGLVLPERQASLGNRSPGRPEQWIEFVPKVAPRLKPLLIRHEQQRSGMLLNKSNPYLLISAVTRRRVHPVSEFFLWNLVQITTKAALGRACNVNTLRKTFAVIVTDEGGGALLRRFGWHHCQATQYAFSEQRIIQSPS